MSGFSLVVLIGLFVAYIFHEKEGMMLRLAITVAFLILGLLIR